MLRFRLWLFCCLTAACTALPSPAERRGLAETLARRQGWHALTIPASPFNLVAYLPIVPTPAQHLTIYLEGDGLAWISGTQASTDPTPSDPMALRLALVQPDEASAYVGRPCQYDDAEASQCPSLYWTGHRFAPEVITATDNAIDVLKKRFSATRLTLVGYSGGGAVAALVAARRTDVERLVTVAGNLDHRAWTTYQRISPLDGSLNAADQVAALSRIQQWHFVGEKDNNITPALVQGFANRFSAGLRPIVRVELGFDHRCCWAEQWPRLWREIQPKLARLQQ